MSDEWPPPGTRPRLPTYELVRDLWTLHGIQSTVTAAIWRNDFGLELRIDHGGELMESRPLALRRRTVAADRRSIEGGAARAGMVRTAVVTTTRFVPRAADPNGSRRAPPGRCACTISPGMPWAKPFPTASVRMASADRAGPAKRGSAARAADATIRSVWQSRRGAGLCPRTVRGRPPG